MGFGAFIRAIYDWLCGRHQPAPELPTHVPPGVSQRPQDQPQVSPPARHRPPQPQRPQDQPKVPPPARHRPPQPQRPQDQPQVSPPARHCQPQPQSPPASPPAPQRPYEETKEDEHYQSLRAAAKREGAQMGQSFQQSHEAYARGNGALAKELSNQGKAHQAEMQRLNTEASEWIFTQNNKGRSPGEVDLHGLYVKEAITFTEQAIQGARRRGDPKLHLIVGKGLHSPQGMAKLKPAIEELMQKQGLIAELDESNGGVLIVNLDGRPSGTGSVIQPDDITRRLENKDDGCTIM